MERRLAAILAADVVGYSRLMEQDESDTLATLKARALSVIARNSSFRFRGEDVDVVRFGRELNVHYVLEGSVRKIGNRLRITAQL